MDRETLEMLTTIAYLRYTQEGIDSHKDWFDPDLTEKEAVSIAQICLQRAFSYKQEAEKWNKRADAGDIFVAFMQKADVYRYIARETFGNRKG